MAEHGIDRWGLPPRFRASRWSALPDERPLRLVPRLLGSAWGDGRRDWSTPRTPHLAGTRERSPRRPERPRRRHVLAERLRVPVSTSPSRRRRAPDWVLTSIRSSLPVVVGHRRLRFDGPETPRLCRRGRWRRLVLSPSSWTRGTPVADACRAGQLGREGRECRIGRGVAVLRSLTDSASGGCDPRDVARAAAHRSADFR